MNSVSAVNTELYRSNGLSSSIISTSQQQPKLSSLTQCLNLISSPPLILPKVVGEDDVRVGSARDGDGSSHPNGPSDFLSLMKSSFGPVLIALGPTVIYMFLSWILFLILRRKFPRVYSPKTIQGIQMDSDLSPKLPTGWTNWIMPFLRISDIFVLQKCSLDGFLFLRYLKILGVICAIGICFVWPVLLPVHLTGGGTQSYTDSITIRNVDRPNNYYAHVVVCWVFTGFIAMMILRECIYYARLRNVYLASSHYTRHKSSKTVLFTSVPPKYLNEQRIRELFGECVVDCWIPRTTGKLKALVKERKKTAIRLEEAEITFIKRANATLDMTPPSRMTCLPIRFAKWLHQDRSRSMSSHPADLEKGNSRNGPEPRNSPSLTESGGNLCQNSSTAPKHAEYSLPHTLSPSLRGSDGPLASKHPPDYARPRHRVLTKFGVNIDTIEWARSHLISLEGQIEKMRREYFAGGGRRMGAVFVEFDSCVKAQAAHQMPIFHQPSYNPQSILGVKPCEIVWGSLRLKWWQRLTRKSVVMVLLIIAIAVWWFPTLIATMATSPDEMKIIFPALENLPLVATNILSGLGRAIILVVLLETVPFFLRACARFTGEPTLCAVESFVQKRYFVFQVVQVFLAPSVMPQVIRSPTTVLTFGIPETSDFYYTYILVRCLQASAFELLQFVELFRHQIKSKRSQSPQTCFKRWHKLDVIHWGGIYPVFTNIGVMGERGEAIYYAFIAPLILAFAATGLCCVYFVYKYNLIYVYDTKTLDTGGLLYPRAFMQLITGPYLAQIYLIGLFAANSAWVQMSLVALLFLSTVFIHVSLRNAINPLLKSFPRALNHDEGRLEAVEDTAVVDDSEGVSYTSPSSIASQGRKQSRPASIPIVKKLLQKLALPSVDELRQIIPQTPTEEEFPDAYTTQRYLPPETWLPKPKLWIPQDDALFSIMGPG
ncbi:hypothetical protein FDECE_12745 [Fusarium decemcellulare]|nr:hypothetical protein FDECE_12745 [Fusarium decemcellulare]